MDWAEYAALFPDGPAQSAYERFRWEARRLMERAATGPDGICKLTAAAPVQEDAVRAVERCQAALVHLLWQQEQAGGYVQRADGSVTGRVVTAVTAGSESVSYAAPQAAEAAQKQAAQYEVIERYLAGVPDANGVNLLYGGRYPAKVG